MIFRRALQREFAESAGAIFVTLFTVLLTTQSIRLLGLAAGGKLASEAVLALIGFAALNYLPVLLSLTVFIAVLMTISRQYKDSEMVVWFASGMSLTAWIRPVLGFALPFVVMIAGLSLLVSPWAVEQSERYRQRLEGQEDTSHVSPGAFQESAHGERVFFVEGQIGETANVQNVFVNTVNEGRVGIIVSKRGYTEVAPNGDKFLVLVNGRRYEGQPGQLDYRVMDFEKYAVRIQAKTETSEPGTGPKQMPTLDLLQKRTNPDKGEFLWRIGLPLSAFTLALLAIPLSFVNPRAGRSANLLLALLTYMVYSNAVSITQAWVAQGKIGFHVGWWVVHVAMFALLVLLFWHRLAVNSVFRMLRR
ncbi:MAG TPA: LPS export ABC transporter permease LptF [Burkholderiales bacterium]|jgi:lipopolysaccharide export system permease protein